MRTRTKVAVTALVLLVIAGVAAADALTKEQTLTAQLQQWVRGDGDASSSAMTDTATRSSQSSQPADVTPAVLQTVVAGGFTFEQKEEPSFLRQLLPGGTVPTYVLLHNGDRAGALSWAETPQASSAFQSLKESLLRSFSPGLQDLRDETVAEEGKPVRSVLTFRDPALSEERLVFVKAGSTLYEVHIAEAKRDVVLPLIDELTAR